MLFGVEIGEYFVLEDGLEFHFFASDHLPIRLLFHGKLPFGILDPGLTLLNDFPFHDLKFPFLQISLLLEVNLLLMDLV